MPKKKKRRKNLATELIKHTSFHTLQQQQDLKQHIILNTQLNRVKVTTDLDITQNVQNRFTDCDTRLFIVLHRNGLLVFRAYNILWAIQTPRRAYEDFLALFASYRFFDTEFFVENNNSSFVLKKSLHHTRSFIMGAFTNT